MIIVGLCDCWDSFQSQSLVCKKFNFELERIFSKRDPFDILAMFWGCKKGPLPKPKYCNFSWDGVTLLDRDQILLVLNNNQQCVTNSHNVDYIKRVGKDSDKCEIVFLYAILQSIVGGIITLDFTASLVDRGVINSSFMAYHEKYFKFKPNDEFKLRCRFENGEDIDALWSFYNQDKTAHAGSFVRVSQGKLNIRYFFENLYRYEDFSRKFDSYIVVRSALQFCTYNWKDIVSFCNNIRYRSQEIFDMLEMYNNFM